MQLQNLRVPTLFQLFYVQTVGRVATQRGNQTAERYVGEHGEYLLARHLPPFVEAPKFQVTYGRFTQRLAEVGPRPTFFEHALSQQESAQVSEATEQCFTAIRQRATAQRKLCEVFKLEHYIQASQVYARNYLEFSEVRALRECKSYVGHLVFCWTRDRDVA